MLAIPGILQHSHASVSDGCGVVSQSKTNLCWDRKHCLKTFMWSLVIEDFEQLGNMLWTFTIEMMQILKMSLIW